jgi:hypothetical protein
LIHFIKRQKYIAIITTLNFLISCWTKSLV